MNIILFIIAWIIGVIFTGFSTIQILIVLFTSIPLTYRFKKKYGDLFDSLIVYIQSIISIIIHLCINFLVYYALIRCHNQYIVYGFLVGNLITIIMSIGKLGINKTNYFEYINTNKKAFAEEIYLTITNKEEVHDTFIMERCTDKKR
ncbi:hypothetical protein JYG23_04225 [Sedimentibacter sp. zth1]|uniref:hypothetical protein n=1 Tax=Sedimentibacter sp. zth1 TaxID=2816908 RepID=UPI001A9218EB|nr:hypothetical protein [Sedimentibacter sp. zth1]QSX06668.1 hypothetical protein JYG23_04225 [Sedimentibacter sp. zth1]